MAWRIQEWVVRGEIDNRQRGFVRGHLTLAGRRDPLELDLIGNCRRDLAGCRLWFERGVPLTVRGRPPSRSLLSPDQDGFVGEMTASRKVRIPAVGDDDLQDRIRLGLPIPTRLGNCLYLEWFTGQGGRVVLESVDFLLTVSEPTWQLSDEEEQAQVRENARRLREYLRRFAQSDEAEE